MYTTPVSTLASQFQTDPQKGLTDSQVLKNRQTYGPNVLPRKKGFTIWSLIINQFADIIVWILFGAAILSFMLQEYIEGWVIIGIVILNAAFGFFQEYKAEKGMEALLSSTVTEVKVIRNSQTILVDSVELVVGDIVMLEAGDKIMADIQLLSDNEAFADESLLTGESLPAQKDSDYISSPKTVIADRKDMLFSGTSLVRGTAKGLVIAVGKATQIGQVVELISSKSEGATPLQHKLAKFSKQIGVVVLFLSLLICLVARYQGKDFYETIFIVVSLAVGSIPEGLVAVVTITLATATKQLFKQKALVRRLRSIESLGVTTVICTDKTGTLTQNKMTVTDVFIGGKTESALQLLEDKTYSEYELLLFQIIYHCNNASLPNVGDPTEIALLNFVKDISFEKLERTSEIPFDSDKKYMLTEHGAIKFIKGSTEAVLALCTKIIRHNEIVELTDNLKKEVLDQNSNYAWSAIRVLGCAYNDIFVGLVGMIDPPREEVKQAIADAYRAGMKVVMITGDHLLTAKAIAYEVGLEGDAMEGREFEESENKLNILRTTCVFARVTPAQKVMICEGLKELGHHVVMTGDGVNDAAALKAADIGFAMGITGTQVSKDASDIVLLDDNFATIVTTIRQGRIVYDNIKKFIVFMLSVNFDEMTRILLSFAIGLQMPFTAIQILWINLVTDSLPALGLGFDKGSDDIMNKPPRDPKQGLLEGQWGRILCASLLSTAVGMALFYYESQYNSIEYARTVGVFSKVCFEMMLIFSFRSATQNVRNLPSNAFLRNSVIIAILIQIIAIFGPFGYIFDFVPLSGEDVVLCFVTGVSGFLIFEGWKWIRYIVRK